MNATEMQLDRFDDQVVENYDTNNNFSTSVAFRASKKPLNANAILAGDDEKRWEVLRGMVAIENGTRMAEVGRISNVELANVTPEEILLSINLETGKKYFRIDLHSETFSLREFASLIGLPVAFLRNNPSELNIENIEYYLGLKKLNNADLCLRFFYLDTPDVAMLRDQNTEQAYPLLFIKQHSLGQEAPAMELQPSDYLAKIANVASETIRKAQVRGLNLRLIRNAATRMNVNGGNQLITLLVENPEHLLWINDEKYQPLIQIGACVNLSKKESEDVRINFGVMRMACENGLMVGISRSAIESMDASLEQDEIEYLANLSPSTSSMKSPAMRISTKVFNTQLSVRLMDTLLDTAIASAQEAKEILSAAASLHYEATPVDFVSALGYAGRKTGMPPKLLKRLASEYVVGHLDGDHSISGPMDVINFMTFNSRTENTDLIEQVESNAYTFSMEIMRQLANKKEELNAEQKALDDVLLGLPTAFRLKGEHLLSSLPEPEAAAEGSA